MTTTTTDLGDGLTLVAPGDGTVADRPAPAVLVLPGGGYAGLADHEGEPVARWLAGLGLHSYLLRYPVRPEEAGEPLLVAPVTAAVAAMRAIRSGAGGLAVDPGRVGVLGFSAGGHLTATLSHADQFVDGAADALPDAAALCYPVISMLTQPHPGSARRLTGDDAPAERAERFSMDRRVGPTTPPSFLWHTATDEGVPVSHSLGYAAALAAHRVPVELHVFPEGRHGLGMAPDDPVVGQWVGLCGRWLQVRFGLEG